MLVITFVYGLWLDADNYIFVYVFPLISILGVFSVFLLTRIQFSY